MPSDQPGQPLLRVIRGDASPEEIAAILAVLTVRRDAAASAAATAARTAPTQVRSVWSEKSRMMRAPMFPSPGGWGRSALPR